MQLHRLTLIERRAIFAALVAAQDLGTMTVPESRLYIMERFGVTEFQLRKIEELGIDKQWPPLVREDEGEGDITITVERFDSPVGDG